MGKSAVSMESRKLGINTKKGWGEGVLESALVRRKKRAMGTGLDGREGEEAKVIWP